MVRVEIQLSRPTVRLGGTVVGTIRCTTKLLSATATSTGSSSSAQTTNANPIRRQIPSLRLCAVGLCRRDPRWHSFPAKSHSTTSSSTAADVNLLPPLPDQYTEPFWSTEPLELMELPERPYGSWQEARPHPIQLPGRRRCKHGRHSKNSSVEDVTTDISLSLDDQKQLIFTFRIAIPHDTPHSLIATSCKYYYLIVLRLVSTNDHHQPGSAADHPASTAEATSTEWIQMPLSVLTAHPSSSIPPPADDDGPVAIVQAMAHSMGLPTHLSATELASWEGEYTVCNPNTVGGGGSLSSIVQSMRVDDPVTGRPVCVLSILGTAPTSLVPGSRLILKFDFPQQPIMASSGGTSPWMPCASVSACLQGQEMVVAVGHSANRRRARRFLFGTAHELVSPTTTECVSLTLILPETAPCSIATHHVEIVVQCLVDIAIGDTKFRNLRLEIPCRVQHGLSDWELPRADGDDDGQAQVDRTLRELWQQSQPSPSIPRFDSHDIVDDLKILSLDLVRRPKSDTSC
jgi:hypothetical protein